jgi:hypothetical protein
MPPRYHTRILFHRYVFALNFLFFCRGRYRLLDSLILHEFYHLSQLVLDKSGEVPASGVNCDFTYLISPWWSFTAKPLALYVAYRARNKSFPRYSLNILHFKNTWTSDKYCCFVTNIWKIKKGIIYQRSEKCFKHLLFTKMVFKINNIPPPPFNVRRTNGRRQCKYGYIPLKTGRLLILPLGIYISICNVQVFHKKTCSWRRRVFNSTWIYNCTPSSSSVGSTTLVGFDLLNCRWAFSAGRFYRVVLPAARQTPNLEENQGFRAFELSPQEAPSVGSDASEPSSGRRNYGRETAEKFCRKWRLPRHFWVLLHAAKHDMGQAALLPLRRKACWGFFRPKNPTASAGFELGYQRPARYL